MTDVEANSRGHVLLVMHLVLGISIGAKGCTIPMFVAENSNGAVSPLCELGEAADESGSETKTVLIPRRLLRHGWSCSASFWVSLRTAATANGTATARVLL